jgi:peptidoglycan/LPS O-acetylase OafA/YrhL
VLWSLSIEEQFYLFIPAMAWIGGRRLIGMVSILLIALAYCTLAYHAGHGNYNSGSDWINGLVQFQFFAAGGLLALLLKGKKPDFPASLRLGLAALGAGCWVASVRAVHLMSEPAGKPLGGPMVMLGWGLVLLGSVFFFISVLGLPSKYVPGSLAYLGKVSFGLYVFHPLVLLLFFQTRMSKPISEIIHSHSSELWILSANGLRALACLVITVALASASYRFYEAPFLRLKERFALIRSRPI